MLREAARHTPSAARGALTLIALSRLARGRQRRPPLAIPEWAIGVTGSAVGGEAPAGDQGGANESSPESADGWRPAISVVIPARDEASRIAGVLAPLRAAPGVVEVIVVDDRSSDDTAAIARDYGATVIDGAELPRGWVGKPWALQQGLVAARGDIVVFLDADVQPDPGLPAAVADLLAPALKTDLASAQLAFTCPGVGQRLLHPALLTTLVYRLGPLDTTDRIPAATAAINGQCFAVRRDALISAGGFSLVSAAPTDDIALARALAGAGWRIAVADGSTLGTVRMYESAAEAIREWAGRSLAFPGAASRPRQLVDLAVIWVVQARPALRLWRALLVAARRRSLRAGVRTLRPADLALLALRLALTGALTRVYRVRVGRARVPDPLSLAAPLTDPVAFAALARGTLRPVRRWRGRAMP